MKKVRKGFTLIELMVVVLLIGILAAIAVPMMRGRIGSAKWSEARAGMGSIATAMRAYAAEVGADGTYPPSKADLGFIESDLEGTYFSYDNYSIPAADFQYGRIPHELTYTIQCDANSMNPSQYQLDENGDWTHN